MHTHQLHNSLTNSPQVSIPCTQRPTTQPAKVTKATGDDHEATTKTMTLAVSFCYFDKKCKKGDFIVAGRNFGCGSSREHAPIALKGVGVAAVIAESFARIFYRNATNVGVPLLEAPGISELVENQEEIEVDMDKGLITNKNGESITFKKLPPFMLEILEQGGLIEYLKNKR